MVVYSCKRCGYQTKIRKHYSNHLERKTPCKVLFENIDIHILKRELEDYIYIAKNHETLQNNACNKDKNQIRKYFTIANFSEYQTGESNKDHEDHEDNSNNEICKDTHEECIQQNYGSYGYFGYFDDHENFVEIEDTRRI